MQLRGSDTDPPAADGDDRELGTAAALQPSDGARIIAPFAADDAAGT